MTLGTISGSINALAAGVTTAYFAALTKPDPATWTTLVTQTARLVDGTRALDGIIWFNPTERAALDFFEGIVRENADLLVSAAIAAVTATLEQRRYESAL